MRCHVLEGHGHAGEFTVVGRRVMADPWRGVGRELVVQRGEQTFNLVVRT